MSITVPSEYVGKWVIDPSHTDVTFTVKHLMISKVRGSFGTVEGTIAAEPGSVKISANIDTNSVTTHDASRDQHLHGEDFFDTEKYPTMRFVSTDIVEHGENQYQISGDLTIKDVTKPVKLVAELNGVTVDGYGQTKLGASASGHINRNEFGLTWNTPLEKGGVLVSDEVLINVEVQAVLQK